jgi:ketosteroid isomerase-like protein
MLVVFALVTVSIAACGSAPKSAVAPTAPTATSIQPTRTTAPAVPTSAPTVVPSPAKLAANANQSGSTRYEGDWQGMTSSADTPISFTVENNQVTFANLAYVLNSGGCSLSGSLSQTVKGVIDGGKFTLQVKDDDGKQYAFAGIFTSSTEANGTLQVTGTSQVCGAFDAKATWTARNSPVASSDTPSISPTAAPVSQDATQGVDAGLSDSDVLLAFFKAINSKNVDAALALVDDQVVFNIHSTPGIGKDDLKAFLQDQMSRNVTFTASHVKGADGVLDFTLQTSDKMASVDGETASIDGGRIQTLVLR